MKTKKTTPTNHVLVLASIVCLLAPSWAVGQVPTQPSGKSLAATLGVFVYPAEGQSSERQSKDEADCYKWAVGNTGIDPFDLAKESQQQQQQAQQAQAQVEAQKQQAAQVGQGAGAGGAVRGAAAGALIGEIASDDPGKGAAYGAAAGLIAGRRRARRARGQAEAQADQQAQQVEKQSQQAQAATQQEMDNFKKAFSVCLEAKDYMVK